MTLDLLAEGRADVLAHHGGAAGLHRHDQMYFETGQGSARSAGAHHEIDQLTCKARAYGVARAFEPFLVDTVVGLIGAEHLADVRQIPRSGLETTSGAASWGSRWLPARSGPARDAERGLERRAPDGDSATAWVGILDDAVSVKEPS